MEFNTEYPAAYEAKVVTKDGSLQIVWVDEQLVEDDKHRLKHFYMLGKEVLNIAIQEKSLCPKDNEYECYPFYWCNGRIKWSLEEVNDILFKKGVVGLLDLFGDNNGRAEYKLGRYMLEEYYRYITQGKEKVRNLWELNTKILEWMKKEVPDFYFWETYPISDEYSNSFKSYHHTKENGVYKKM
jgi:hypothetical protein